MAIVLCVDDDFVVANLVAEVVRFCHLEPAVETSSIDAIAKWVRDERLVAVLADYLMPKMDGIELLQVFREQRPSVRRVMITAAPGEAAVRRASTEGVVQMVISKPPTIPDIRMALMWL